MSRGKDKYAENLLDESSKTWLKNNQELNNQVTRKYFYEVNCNEADRDFRLENNICKRNTNIAFFKTNFMTVKNLCIGVSLNLSFCG